MLAISVVIPTYNRRTRLKRVLAALECQTARLSSFEVIVVSDGSTDGTDELLTTLHPPFSLAYVRQENRGPSAARNAGLARATADIVLFLDDDVVPDERLVEEHLEAHGECGDDVAVIGPLLVPGDHPRSVWVDWEDVMLQKRYRSLESGAESPTGRIFYTGNASLRRRYVLDTDGFNLAYRRGEDVELGLRLEAKGLRFVFCPKARGWHHAERDYLAWSRMADAYGRADTEISGRDTTAWLRASLVGEFRRRHIFVRALARTGAGRPGFARTVAWGCKVVAEGAWRLKLYPVARAACSAIFNVRYYHAMADAMGGRDKFLGEMYPSDR